MMLAILATTASALPGTFSIEQIYSNANGTVQFIVIYDRGHTDCDANEDLWAGVVLASSGPGPYKLFAFPTNLPTCATSGRRILIATEGFAALGLVSPDYVIPNGFLQMPNGEVNFADVSQVAYTGLPNDGVAAINGSGIPIQNLATNFTGASASVVPTSPPPPPAVANYAGLWWNLQESGWGINFSHQGDTIFATWFTYGADNQPLWYTIVAHKSAGNVYSGNVSSFAGLPFNSVPYTANANVKTPAGTATITFAADGKSATFAYTVNGITQSKQIVPQQFSPGVPLPMCVWGAQSDLTLATNYQDLWWVTDGQESGWGINFTHQGTTIFATWFTYDTTGKAWWLQVVAQETAVPKVFSGLVKTVTGPPFNTDPFDPNAVNRTTAGNATITIIDGNHAKFEYTVNGVSQTKNLTRQVFAPPGTVCQ